MARIMTVALFLMATPFVVSGQEAQNAGGGGAAEASTHTVAHGETLWELAYRYYQDPFHWPTIYEANRDRIMDPHWIYPDQDFVIPGAPTHPPQPFPPAPDEGAEFQGVSVQSGGGAGVDRNDRAPAIPRARRRIAAGEGPDYRTVFYQRSVDRGGVISAGDRHWLVVPRDVFYSAEWLETGAQPAADIGRVEAFQHIGDASRSARSFDRLRIEVRPGRSLEVGDALQVFRAARTEEGLGTVMVPTGRLVVSRLESPGAIAVVTAEYDRMQIGDRIAALPAFDLEPGMYPLPTNQEQTGTILSFARPKELYGHGDIAFVSVGAEDGAAVGDEYEVRPLDGGGDWPADAVGRLQVVRVGSGQSSARIIGIESPVFVQGAPLRLVRKMVGGPTS